MTTMMKTVTLATLAAGVLAGAALSAVAQRPSSAETYRLADVDGRALPVVVDQEGECREELLGGTLTLETDGRWLLVTSERDVCGESVEPAEESREDGRYTAEGSTIRFLDDDGEVDTDTDDDPSEIEVEDLSVGTRSAGALSVRLRDGRTVLSFRQ